MKTLSKFLSVLVLVLVFGAAGYVLVQHEQPQVALGAAPGPDVYNSDHYSWNGVVVYPSRSKAVNATTTPCAFKSPNATTTLSKFSVNFPTSISTTSASTVYLATSTTAFATTTNLVNIAFPQSAAGTVVATSSIQTANHNIIAPGTWLVVAVAGQAAFYDPQATCQVEFTGV